MGLLPCYAEVVAVQQIMAPRFARAQTCILQQCKLHLSCGVDAFKHHVVVFRSQKGCVVQGHLSAAVAPLHRLPGQGASALG